MPSYVCPNFAPSAHDELRYLATYYGYMSKHCLASATSTDIPQMEVYCPDSFSKTAIQDVCFARALPVIES